MKTFLMPDLGEDVKSAKVIDVVVKEGQSFKEDDVVLEIETDKATVEVPSEESGTVEEILVKPGEEVKVGAPVFKYK